MLKEPSPDPMYTRRHIIAFAGGMSLSFFIMLLVPLMQGTHIGGQLLAGDPSANRRYPTTLNAVQGAVDTSTGILQLFSSAGWWMMMGILGIVLSFMLLRIIRRWV